MGINCIDGVALAVLTRVVSRARRGRYSASWIQERHHDMITRAEILSFHEEPMRYYLIPLVSRNILLSENWVALTMVV